MGADCEELQKDLLKHSDCRLKWETKYSINCCVQKKNKPNLSHEVLCYDSSTHRYKMLGLQKIASQ